MGRLADGYDGVDGDRFGEDGVYTSEELFGEGRYENHQLPSAVNAEIIDPFIQSPRPSRNIKTVFELCRRARFLFFALITTSSQLCILYYYNSVSSPRARVRH